MMDACNGADEALGLRQGHHQQDSRLQVNTRQRHRRMICRGSQLGISWAPECFARHPKFV